MDWLPEWDAQLAKLEVDPSFEVTCVLMNDTIDAEYIIETDQEVALLQYLHNVGFIGYGYLTPDEPYTNVVIHKPFNLTKNIPQLRLVVDAYYGNDCLCVPTTIYNEWQQCRGTKWARREYESEQCRYNLTS